jgi:outer membrane protein
MNHKRLKFILLAWALPAFTAGYAQTAPAVHQLTVKEAVEQAFKNLPGLKNLEIDYQLQQSVNSQITANAYPQVTGSASVSHYLQLPQFLFPDGTATAIYSILKEEGVKDGGGLPINKEVAVTNRQVSFQQPWNASVGATLNQLLFQPDVFVGLQARATALDFAKSNIAVEKEKVREQAYKQYYAVLIAEKQLVFIKEGIVRVEKLKHDVEEIYKNGFVEKLDIDKVTVPLNNLKTRQNTLENLIALNYAALKYAIGVPQTDSIVLKDVLTVEELKKNIPAETTFDYNERKEFQLLNTAKKLQLLDVKRQKLSNLPTVSAFLSYTVQGQSQNFITSKDALWLRTSLVGLQVNVPIFNGFQRRYKMQEAQLKVNKIDNNIGLLKQAIDLEQTVNKRAFTIALMNLDIQQRNMDLAKTIYNTTKKKYEQGLARNDEVLLSENEITTAESNYFEALYQATISKITLLRAMGRLD